MALVLKGGKKPLPHAKRLIKSFFSTTNPKDPNFVG